LLSSLLAIRGWHFNCVGEQLLHAKAIKLQRIDDRMAAELLADTFADRKYAGNCWDEATQALEAARSFRRSLRVAGATKQSEKGARSWIASLRSQ